MENEIRVKNAVLHILDTSVGMPVLSNKEIEADGETLDFITSLLQKTLHDDNIKPAQFNGEENPVRALCLNLSDSEPDFLTVSRELAGILFNIMSANPNISPADLLCCQAELDGITHYILFKLNYRSNYIHYVHYDEETNVNLLVKQKTVLPSENQRPEECILIRLDDLSLKLIEKEVEMADGNKVCYLSKLFLNCQDQLSNAQKAKILSKTAQKLSKKHYSEDFESMAKLKQTIYENMEDGNGVAVVEVAQEIFHGNTVIQQEFLEEIQKAGINETKIQLPEKVAERKFGTHKIKTDTGVEINFPSIYYKNNQMMEFINNNDGTISIVIKNVSKITSK